MSSNSRLFDDSPVIDVEEGQPHRLCGLPHHPFQSRFIVFSSIGILCSLLLVVVIAVILISSTSSSLLPPPKQFSTQKSTWESANIKAALASTNARSSLLTYLDSKEFRLEISNITSLQGLSSSQLLTIIQTLVISSPMQHNFPLTKATLDVNLTAMMSLGFLPNFYTGYLEGFLDLTSNFLTQDYAETVLMGFPNFSSPLAPTLQEALIRPQYACINIYGIAGGCLVFGEMSLVSKPSWAQPMAILSAVDTGLYVGFCRNISKSGFSGQSPIGNQTINGGNGTSGFLGLNWNCSGWDGTVGTYENFNHLLLANTAFLGSSLAWLLQRKLNGANFCEPEYYGTKALMGFIEGDLSGALLFPDSVSYVQLATTGVFGTSIGTEAIEWAASSTWPLVWYEGLEPSESPIGNNKNDTAEHGKGSGGVGGGTDLINFILDPYSARNTTNISISDAELKMSQELFRKTWDTLESSAFLPGSSSKNISWNQVWVDLLNSLSQSLRLGYSNFTTCQDLETCFAIQLSSGDCVCRTT